MPDPVVDPVTEPATTEPLNINTYGAQSLDVSDDMTVQGQIDSIINKNSPLMQTAQTGAKKDAQKRGLLNSSMAVGAGQEALIKQALPIAQADAKTHFTAAGVNQAADNRATEFNAGQQNQGVILQEQGKQSLNNIDATTQQGLTLGEQKRTSDLELQDVRGDQAFELANIEGNYKQLLNASQSAQQSFSAVTAAIAEINSNTDIPTADKTILVNQQIQLLEGSLRITGAISDIDINGLLMFNG